MTDPKPQPEATPAALSISVLPEHASGPDRSCHGGERARFGWFSRRNPAADGRVEAGRDASVLRTVVWGGWLDEAADPARGRFARDFHAWSPEAWERLRRGITEMQERMGEGETVCLRPAAGCIVGDPQACLTWLREDRPAGVELLLDVASMMTPEMLTDIEEHAGRAFEALAEQPAVAGTVLATPVVSSDGHGVDLAPLSVGSSAADVMVRAWRDSPLVAKPVLVVDKSDAAMLA